MSEPGDRKEIKWEPRRMQISLHEDRLGDLHVRIDHQPSGDSTVAIIERDELRPFWHAAGTLGQIMRTLESPESCAPQKAPAHE